MHTPPWHHGSCPAANFPNCWAKKGAVHWRWIQHGSDWKRSPVLGSLDSHGQPNIYYSRFMRVPKFEFLPFLSPGNFVRSQSALRLFTNCWDVWTKRWQAIPLINIERPKRIQKEQSTTCPESCDSEMLKNNGSSIAFAFFWKGPIFQFSASKNHTESLSWMPFEKRDLLWGCMRSLICPCCLL